MHKPSRLRPKTNMTSFKFIIAKKMLRFRRATPANPIIEEFPGILTTLNFKVYL